MPADDDVYGEDDDNDEDEEAAPEEQEEEEEPDLAPVPLPPVVPEETTAPKTDLPGCRVKRNYTCGSCDFSSQNPRHYLHHRRDEHGDRVRIYECENCLYASKHHQKLTRHSRMVHGSPEGPKKRPAPADSPHHTTAATPATTPTSDQIKTKFFRCTKCSYVTSTKARFTKHVKYHSMPMIKCNLCDFRTPYKWNLDRHYKNHGGHGTFRCCACNFTADIKQSLTVHEMNHHVPPVGLASGASVGRRRNKVGASDAPDDSVRDTTLPPSDPPTPIKVEATSLAAEEPKKTVKKAAKPPAGPNHLDQPKSSSSSFGKDFIHPDDFVHHANGNVYIKAKCKLCSFKSAWEGEMARHEERVHRIFRDPPKMPQKKASRPIPNLIPIQKQSQEISADLDELCARSANSSLKDFAPLFAAEEAFTKKAERKPPESFFDRLKEKLPSNLVCELCGHESKCLSESAKHQKTCGRPGPGQSYGAASSGRNLSSTRCQHCRQRCKSSADLLNHLQTCQPERPPERPPEPHPMENVVFVWNDIQEPPSQPAFPGAQQPQLCSMPPPPLLAVLEEAEPLATRAPPLEVEQPVHTPTKMPTHGTDLDMVAEGKRVFMCPHCSFWASTASRFHVHIVGHLNKKPFECSICSYRSNWRWDITKHIRLKSARDPTHERAKVLMTDETGRRNYSKYNKYLMMMKMKGSGSGGSPPEAKRVKLEPAEDGMEDEALPPPLPKLTKAPSSLDFQPAPKSASLRPPPPLRAADGTFYDTKKKPSGSGGPTATATTNRKVYKCKMCNFRDASHDNMLQHVKKHCKQEDQDEASVTRGSAPFQCGHCHQVSNWKHVIQRHCRLKHSGDVRVVIGSKNGSSVKIEMEDQADEPDHVDVPQLGAFKCSECPYSSDTAEELSAHSLGHTQRPDWPIKCYFCAFFVGRREDLREHTKLHGVSDPDDFIDRVVLGQSSGDKKYKCVSCPYVSNSKSQFLYHKQFHRPRGAPFKCRHCNYNVTRRHLLNQHLRVHGVSVPAGQKAARQAESVAEELKRARAAEEDHDDNESEEESDVPLVWVSKDGQFNKMFKCRHCPHVNSRRAHILEHEKMHLPSPSAEHRCPDCSYCCNSSGALASHLRAHQGLLGRIHCLVDTLKTDEEQVSELARFFDTEPKEILLNNNNNNHIEDEAELEELKELKEARLLHFCDLCPARFFCRDELTIHRRFHEVRLFYKCEVCSYNARQRPNLLGHEKVHSQEYQEKTRALLGRFKVHKECPPPRTAQLPSFAQPIWVVAGDAKGEDADGQMDVEDEGEAVEVKLEPQPTRTMEVPISGTELYQQKTRTEQEKTLMRPNDHFPAPPRVDPQFGILMHGNPKFVYPTYRKNGRLKEKRYKCHKCPSAFEKRDQYKVHLSLHGSKQRYSCDACDYAVKYYANYVQHVKKHQMNESALALKNGDDEGLSSGQSPVEQQQQQQHLEAKPGSEEVVDSERKLFRCDHCPYGSQRRDAVDNHSRRHVAVSGTRSNFTCAHCDYTAPQSHYLREHQKVHFSQLRQQLLQQPQHQQQQAEAYMLQPEEDDDDEEEEDQEEEPVELEANASFVNVETGELVAKE